MLHSQGCSLLCCHTCCKWCAFTRTFKTHITGACPGNHISLGIADGDDGVVKSGTNVSYTNWNILTRSAACTLSTPTWSCHWVFLLSIRPISAYRQCAWDLCEFLHWSSCVAL